MTHKQFQKEAIVFAGMMPAPSSKGGTSGTELQSNPAIGMNVADHSQCEALSGVLRGKLCDQLTRDRAGHLLALGSYLYTAGEPAKSIYYVRSGLLKTSIVSEDGKELILRVHKPGDIFGELCFCSGRRREQAMAMEDSKVVQITFDDLISHLQKNRQALSDFMSLMSQYLADSYERLPIFFFHRTMERLISTLLKLADELGEPSGEGFKIAHYIKQEELAAMIGAPRQVVSSLLNQLRDLRLVGYARKGSLTVNKKALQSYLHSTSSE